MSQGREKAWGEGGDRTAWCDSMRQWVWLSGCCALHLTHLTQKYESGRVWTAGIKVALANVGVGVAVVLLAF